MNSLPRDFRPRRPPQHNEKAFNQLLHVLPDDALERLQAIVDKAQRTGANMDLLAIATALLTQSVGKMTKALPDLPDHLMPLADPELNGGREYALLLNVDPTDLVANMRVRRQFISEIEHVRDLVQDGMDATEAWKRVARRSVFDDAVPTFSNRFRRRRSLLRVRLDDDN